MSFRSPPAEFEILGVHHGGHRESRRFWFARAVRAQDLELFAPCALWR